MGGFINIDSWKAVGTTVRVSIAQNVVDPSPCLSVENERFLSIVLYVVPEKYKVGRMLDFYRDMATHMAAGLRVNLYSASSFDELKKLTERRDITHVFMGESEYVYSPEYIDELASGDITVAVCADRNFKTREGSRVIVMSKPLYAFSVVKVLNGEAELRMDAAGDEEKRPVLDGIRALVVDDEPMNLVVATGLFREYNMIIDTADSGKEALIKYANNDYDVVFMDHMMPEMDGVEAMKRIRELALQKGQVPRVIALTANAISGAREMFLREGFDGFISKPIQLVDFERTMNRVIPSADPGKKGGLL